MHEPESTLKTSRRIRFAPLVDPRRAVVVTEEEGDQDDIPATSQTTTLSRPHSHPLSVNILKPFKRPPSPKINRDPLDLFRSSSLSSDPEPSSSTSSSPLETTKPKKSTFAALFSSTTSSPPPSHRHKGARMLNGRIYGTTPNPFASARDDEPEFVEWGYGGMGSVKGAKSAGVTISAVNWERLSGGAETQQQRWVVPGGGRGGAAVRRRQGSDESDDNNDDDDDDDGSGLAWVRKRRRMREERKRKEEEEDDSTSSEDEKRKTAIGAGVEKVLRR